MEVAMGDLMELVHIRKMAVKNEAAYKTHMYMIDDMMDEILMLDNPEAMREIASFVKEIIKDMEGI